MLPTSHKPFTERNFFKKWEKSQINIYVHVLGNFRSYKAFLKQITHINKTFTGTYLSETFMSTYIL